MRILPTILPTLLLTMTALPSWAAVDYESQVKPIFDAKCAKCHGAKRQLGDLALHADALPSVIEDGLILEGDAENSDVFTRLLLPTDDKLLMPKGGDPLPPEEIDLIKNWINEGAHLASAAAAPMPAEQQTPEPLPTPQPASAEVLQRLEAAGALVTPLYAGSPLLSISFPTDKDQVTDETLDTIAVAGANVAWLNLAGTRITDAGVAKLAACNNLIRLHLERTAVTDAVASTLASLDRLEYLNLYGTKITDAALAELGKLPRLTSLYVWQTGVSYEAAKKLMAECNQLDINVGENHPGVVRERLTSELARVTQAKQAAAKQAAQAEATLQQAKEAVQAATDREHAINQELEALDQPK